MNGSMKIGAEVRRKLVLNLDVEAGKTIHRDLTVPRRENCRDVKVRKYESIDQTSNRRRWKFDG